MKKWGYVMIVGIVIVVLHRSYFAISVTNGLDPFKIVLWEQDQNILTLLISESYMVLKPKPPLTADKKSNARVA